MYRVIIIKVFLIILSFVAILAAAIYSVGYHGERNFSKGSKLPSKVLLIQNASKLKGALYDPLMGMHGNIGADLGFMVCSDVPNIAYGLSGYSLKLALAKDYKKNPSVYDSRDGNNPGNPYFHRRARNIYAYFKSIGQLMPSSYNPSVGDLAFYKNTKNGYIAHIALVIGETEAGYKLIESAPKTVLVQEVSNSSPIERGWVLSGYGKVGLE